MDLHTKTVKELSEMLAKKECSSVELTKHYLSRIESNDKDINAYITVTAENAVAQAEKADALIAAGNRANPLTGIPLAVKDNISTKGILTTCASKMLANYVAPFNSTVMDKINDSGMVMLGKLNHDEFVIGTSGETSYYGSTKNPHNANYTPGGSSSGSAAAVSSGETPLALGTDTGGSIRLPSSFCGVVGLKPSYGAVSRYGAVAIGSSLEQIGPIGYSVEDVAMLYDVIKGYDAKDANSYSGIIANGTSKLGESLKGKKIGLIKEYLEDDTEVNRAVIEAANLLKANGAEIVEISVGNITHALSAYYILSSAEISSNMARFDGVRFGFRAEDYSDVDDMFVKTRSQGLGAETQRRIMFGTYVLNAELFDSYYKRAKIVQDSIKENFSEMFTKCDTILTPTTSTTAFEVGKATSDPGATYKSDLMTTPVNLAGLPAISVPCGIGKNNLPIGMQLIGRYMDEATILSVANEYEKIRGDFPSSSYRRGDM